LRLPSSTLTLTLGLTILPLGACKKGAEVPEDTGEEGPAILEHCGEIAGDEIWTVEHTHIITCDVEVTGTLQLDPGVEVYADRDTALRILGGSLVALGESEAGILLASHEGFPLAGDWVGLVGEDADLQLSWVTLRHAGSDGALLQLDGGTASLEQLIISNGISTGLSATDTSFSVIQGIELAYMPTPVELPWTAAAVLSGIFFQEVGSEYIALTGSSLDAEASLPAQDFPYLSQGVTIVEGGRLEVEAGALLELAGDVLVEAGGLLAYGDQITQATIQAHDLDTGVAITIGAGAEVATFRYAKLLGTTISSAAAELYFEDCEVSGAMGTALTVTGGIKDAHPDNFADNSFAGDGLGLLVDLDLLPAIGTNDYSGASFDGVAVAGGTVEVDTEITTWPSTEVLVTGDLELTSGSFGMVGGTLLFADGTGLEVSGASLSMQGMTLTHQGESAGGWRGLEVSGGSLDLTESSVLYGGADAGANIAVAVDASVTDNTIAYSAGWGILVEGDAAPTIQGNSYQNNALGDVGP
jgi:hypothetical protein